MASGFPNSIREGIPWSADLEPDGPDYDADDQHSDDSASQPQARISQYEPYGYDDLPDIAVPKHKVS